MIWLLSTIAVAEVCPATNDETLVSWEREKLLEWGDWTVEDGNIKLEKKQPIGRWNVWAPQQQTKSDVVFRLSIEPGKRTDVTMLARMTFDDKGSDEMSGYGLSLENKSLALYRFDFGEARQLTTPVEITEKSESVTLLFELSGNGLYGYVCNSQTNEILARTSAVDSAYDTGLWGLRQHHKQSQDTKVKQLSFAQQTHHAPIVDGPDVFGTEVLVQIDSDAPLPVEFFDYRISFPPYGGQWLLLPNRELMDTLTEAGTKIRYSTGRIPYWVRNHDYRLGPPLPKASQDGQGFVLDHSYKDPRMVADLLKAYHAKYPDVTELHTLGNSRQGRPIWALRITDNPRKDEYEPTVLMIAAHHGSELLSTEYALDSIDEILRGAEGTHAEWITELDMWVVPLVNPDGNACLWEIDENFGRKNCWDVNQDGQIEATEGIDLNRNYPLGWGTLGEKGSRTWPRSNYYRGPEAASEPETQSILTWSQTYQPAVVMSWHTTGNMLLSPYTIDGLTPLEPDVPWQIAEQLLDGVEAPVGRRTPPRLKRKMYSVDGVDQDWHLYNHGAMAYIIEGSHHNPLDRNIRNGSVEAYRPIRNRLLDHLASGPVIRIQVMDSNGYPVRAEVTVEGIDFKNDEAWKTRSLDGRWDFLVPEHDKYRISIKADGFAEQTVSVNTKTLKYIKLK
jgi:hypothetical protein